MWTSWSSGPRAKDPRAREPKATRRRRGAARESRILASNEASKFLVEIAVRAVRKRWRECDGDACTCAACDGYCNKKRQQFSHRCLRCRFLAGLCWFIGQPWRQHQANVTRTRRILAERTVRASIGRGAIYFGLERDENWLERRSPAELDKELGPPVLPISRPRQGAKPAECPRAFRGPLTGSSDRLFAASKRPTASPCRTGSKLSRV